MMSLSTDTYSLADGRLTIEASVDDNLPHSMSLIEAQVTFALWDIQDATVLWYQAQSGTDVLVPWRYLYLAPAPVPALDEIELVFCNGAGTAATVHKGVLVPEAFAARFAALVSRQNQPTDTAFLTALAFYINQYREPNITTYFVIDFTAT